MHVSTRMSIATNLSSPYLCSPCYPLRNKRKLVEAEIFHILPQYNQALRIRASQPFTHKLTEKDGVLSTDSSTLQPCSTIPLNLYYKSTKIRSIADCTKQAGAFILINWISIFPKTKHNQFVFKNGHTQGCHTE